MAVPTEFLKGMKRSVVGSFGNAESLARTTTTIARQSGDSLEIRLDLLVSENHRPDREMWSHLIDMPILFTARRRDEGSSIDLTATERTELLEIAIDDAWLIDIEVASIEEMAGAIERVMARGIPWVASYHDFERLPPTSELVAAAMRAKAAGASIFKAAARLHSPADLARLAEFQLADHGIAIATMGMGPLAPVSRLLCAQSGSVLNYGYIGETPTAPGQWSAEFLKQAISRLDPYTLTTP